MADCPGRFFTKLDGRRVRYSGPQGESSEEDLQDWDTNAWSDNSQANEDFASVGNTGLEVGTQAFYGGYLGNVNNVTEIHFDESLFLIQDDGAGTFWYHSIPRPARERLPARR